jgi:hypothetical protein
MAVVSLAWKPPLPRSFDLSAGVSSKAGEDQLAAAGYRVLPVDRRAS